MQDSEKSQETGRRELPSSTQTTFADAEIQTTEFMRPGQFLSFEVLDDEQVRFFCGLERKRVQALFDFIVREPTAGVVCALPLIDQLFLTLAKYKLDQGFTFLAVMFKITRKIVSKIFRTWTKIIYARLKAVDWWSLRKKGEGFYTAVIDCTEIPFLSSSSPEIHQQLFSQYKNRTTGKALIAIDENGSQFLLRIVRWVNQ